MHRPAVLAQVSSERRIHRMIPGALVLAALLLTAAGLYLLWLHGNDSLWRPYRASCAMLLILLGAFHARWAWLATHRVLLVPPAGQVVRSFAQGMFWSGILAYLAALALGPHSSADYLFLALLAAGFTASVLTVVMRPRWLANVQRFLTRPGARVGLRAAYVVALAIVGLEATLEIHSALTDHRLTTAYLVKTNSLPPGARLQGSTVNRAGYWDTEFQSQCPRTVYRVAVLGDEVTLSGTAQTNYLARLERRMPGIEVYNFGLPCNGPDGYAAQLINEVAAYQPQLVLACVSIRDDITRPLAPPERFDWRGLHIFQAAVRLLPAEFVAGEIPSTLANTAIDRETYLRRASEPLELFHTPIRSAVRDKWQQALGSLDRLVHACSERNIPLAFVLVPCEIQLSPVLCREVCRRSGSDMDKLDIELPQRRLTAFAGERGVPVLDLLPHLKRIAATAHRHNDRQWTDEGHSTVAQCLGSWLETSHGMHIPEQVSSSGP